MIYKICLIKNRYTGIIAINKYVVEWFKTYANLTVELNTIETDFDVTTMKAQNYTFSGVIPGLDIIDKLKTVIPENKYNAVVFLYGNDLNGIRVSSTNFMGANPLYPDTEIILTHIGDDQGRVINHEMFHCFFLKLKRLQINLVDNLDSYIQNSNMLVDNIIDTNREVALQTLKPYWSQICAFRTQTTQITPKPTQIYNYFSAKEVATWKLKPELCQILDKMREIASTPFIITSGLRTPQENLNAGGKANSSHLRALACDLLCTDNTKRTKMLKGVLNCGIPVFLEVAKAHLHIDIDSSIHQMGMTIVSEDD